jgi:phage shock protein PspC (stress-responsive transcriptional regulator)
MFRESYIYSRLPGAADGPLQKRSPLGSSTIPEEARVPDLKAPLRRSRSDRKIAGVVGGLAKYLNMDPTLARVRYVVISIVSAAFPGILVYIILWVIIPQEG